MSDDTLCRPGPLPCRQSCARYRMDPPIFVISTDNFARLHGGGLLCPHRIRLDEVHPSEVRPWQVVDAEVEAEARRDRALSDLAAVDAEFI